MSWLVVVLFLLLAALCAVPFAISSTSKNHEEKTHEHIHQIDLAKADIALQEVTLEERIALTRVVMGLLNIGYALGLSIPDVLHDEFCEFRQAIVPIVIEYDSSECYRSVEHLKDLSEDQRNKIYELLAGDVEFLAMCTHWSLFLDNYMEFYNPKKSGLPMELMVSRQTIHRLKAIKEPRPHAGHHLTRLHLDFQPDHK